MRAEKTAHQRRFFHWELEFPEVFFNDDGTPRQAPGFDAVVGNPPYGMPRDAELKEFAAILYRSAEGRDDLYRFFTERAAMMARPRGFFSYIVSNTILSNRFDAKLRRLLLSSFRWRSLVTFGFPVFPDPTVHTAIFTIQNQPPEPDHRLSLLARVASPTALSRKGRGVDQRSYLADQFCLMSVVEDQETEQVVGRIGQAGQPLGQIAHIRQCIKTGDDKLYLQTSPTRLPPPWKPVLGGSDVSRYCISWPYRYLKYGNWLARNWQNPDFFERPKIVVRETSERITASLDEEKYYLLSTLYSIYFREGFEGEENLAYLLALLNSDLAQFYMHHLVFALSAGAFIKARANHYARLPIRRIDFNTPSAKREKQLNNGKQRYEKALASNDEQVMLGFVDAELHAARTDVVHDMIGFLVQRMVEMNQQKRTIANRFLTDLKDFHGIDVRSMNPKTKIDKFWKLEAANIFAHFRANRVQLGGSDEEKIRERFSKSKSAIVPLDSQAAFTDRLIGQIVYRLYGLTAEEIKIVEGSIIL